MAKLQCKKLLICKGGNKIYYYKAINLEGKEIEGNYNGKSIENLTLNLKSRGFFIIKYRKTLNLKEKIKIYKPSNKSIYIFCKQLTILLSSGVTITQSINILSENNSNKIFKSSLLDINKNLLEGKSLSSSMKKYKLIYPSLLIEMIWIGEKSGTLSTVLEKLTIFYEQQYKMDNKLRKALVYPIVLCLVSFISILFLINNILPQFIDILKNTSVSIPKQTSFIIYTFKFFHRYKFIILIVFIFLIMFLHKYFKSERGDYNLSKVKLKFPILKNIYSNLYIYKICTTLGIIIKSGMNINQSFEILSSVVKNKIIERKIIDVKECIQQGETLTNSFKNNYLFNSNFLSMIYVGEESGNLDNVFITLGKLSEEQVYITLDSMIKLIEPIIILVVSIIILIIILSIAVPMLDIIDTCID
ncbi:type II secretion system F family protein [Clostridium rectalis]|uniref:type II secretion system F family protein n=1 Tax=Clostridium rectalis TaxID=2040295 RepID=UPI0013DE3F2E|nr:type II secretion system F family protein [Clostridium rectalis]